MIPCKCQSYFFQFTLGLSLNCLQCGNGGNFPNGQGCQGYEEGTSVLCSAGSDTCMKSTCGLQSSTNIVIFKDCADSPDSADLPCHIEVNISIQGDPKGSERFWKVGVASTNFSENLVTIASIFPLSMALLD